MADNDQALIRISDLSFEGAGTYLSPTSVELANKGRVLISGVEGAGKSLIPEVLSIILYGKGSPRVRSEYLTESTISGKAAGGYRGDLTFDTGFGTNARTVQITQAFKHAKLNSRYIISVDKERTEPTTKPAQRKLVNKLVPLSYEEWLGVVYLYQGGLHDMLAGKDAQKREYLTTAFGLRFNSDMLIEAQEEYKRLTKLSVSMDDLRRNLADVDEDLKKQHEVLDSVEGGQEAVISSIAKATERIESTATAIGQLEQHLDVIASLSTLKKELKGCGDLTEEEASEALKLDVEKEKGLAQQVGALTADMARLKKAQAAFTEYKQALQSATAARDKAADKANRSAERVKGIPPESVLVERRQVWLAASKTAKLDNKYLGYSKVSGNWRQSFAEASEKMRIHNKLASLEQCCPTCNRPFDANELQVTMLALSKEAAQAMREGLSFVAHDLGIRDEVQVLFSSVITTIEQQLQYHSAAIEDMRTLQQSEERLKWLNSHEVSAPPSMSESQEELAKKQAQLNKVRERIENNRHIISIHQRIKAVSGSVPDESKADIKAKLELLDEKVSKAKRKLLYLQGIKSELDAAEAAINTLSKRKKAVEEEIDRHVENAMLAQTYNDTIVPYFSALRSAKVQGCVSVLEGVLPLYIETMISPQYRGAHLKLQVDDDLSNVDLLLKTSADAPWLSAVNASSGQRQRFTLTLMAALREVTPRKANIMFFDEPFAHLQSEGKMLFVNRLLPLMMERNPDLKSVFVMAHDYEVLNAARDSFDNRWTVSNPGTGSVINNS